LYCCDHGPDVSLLPVKFDTKTSSIHLTQQLCGFGTAIVGRLLPIIG
jgi:hypothetical protein